MASEKTKRIAKNTMALYFRMAISMVVGLYTSRIVLETLGVEDFGVYNVVGGVISMFTFISTSLGSATSRFITYALGEGNMEKLKLTFSTGMVAMISIAVVIVMLGETVGLWFMENKLVIPEESMASARIVYQLSIASVFIGLTQVPYTACIMAHEKMGVYAYLELLNVTLRLLIVYLLVIVDTNKLELYAVLVFVVSIIMVIINRIYCHRKFMECRVNFTIDRHLLKKMLAFSGWDLYGNCSTIVRSTGVSMLVNMFFGVVANAAIGVATSVQSAVASITGNIVSATRPQIIKSYASGDYTYMVGLIMSLSRVVFLLLLMISIPLIIEMNFILGIWLKQVPEYASGLASLTILFLFFSSLSYIACTGVHAIGDLRRCNFINGTLYMMVLPISWLAFKWFDGSVYIPYALNAFFVLVGCLVNVYTVHLYVPQMSLWKYVLNVLLRCAFIAILGVLSAFFVVYFFEGDNWLRAIIVALVSWVVIALSGYKFALDTMERNFIAGSVRDFCFKICVRSKG